MNKLKEWFKNNRRNIAVIFAIFILDRLTKAIALFTIAVHGPYEVWRFFSFTYAENTGIAFSLFENGNTLLIFVMLGVLVFLLKNWGELSAHNSKLGNLGLSFIFGGAIGNLYDRVFLGFVVDMLDFKVWPVFNLADSFICIGAGLIFISFIKKGKETK